MREFLTMRDIATALAYASIASALVIAIILTGIIVAFWSIIL